MSDDEILLDAEAEGVAVTLEQIADPPPAPPAVPRAPGYGDDEWAGHLADGRVLAFLREPVARCHLDRLEVVDGGRRLERPLPAWVYYGHFLAQGPRGVLIGGHSAAWRLEADGSVTTLLEEPDGQGVHVAWCGETAVLAGWRVVALDGPDGRVELPCSGSVSACVVAPDLIVVSDDDGSMWIADGRVVARDWRPYREARGDVILSMAGDAFRVRVSRG